jgi:hypothetical protein
MEVSFSLSLFCSVSSYRHADFSLQRLQGDSPRVVSAGREEHIAAQPSTRTQLPTRDDVEAKHQVRQADEVSQGRSRPVLSLPSLSFADPAFLCFTNRTSFNHQNSPHNGSSACSRTSFSGTRTSASPSTRRSQTPSSHSSSRTKDTGLQQRDDSISPLLSSPPLLHFSHICSSPPFVTLKPPPTDLPLPSLYFSSLISPLATPLPFLPSFLGLPCKRSFFWGGSKRRRRPRRSVQLGLFVSGFDFLGHR